MNKDQLKASPSVYEFAIAEFTAAHAALDKASIASNLQGEQLSLSQRIEFLVDITDGLRQQVKEAYAFGCGCDCGCK